MLRRSILVVDSSASCSAPPPLFACRRFFAASATGARIDANRSSRHEPRTTRQTTHHTTKRGSTEEKTPIGLFFFAFSFDFFNILPLAIRVCVWLVCVLMYLSLLSFCQNEMVLLLSSCTNRGALFPTSVSHFFRFVSSRLCFQLDIERERMRRLAGVSFYFVSFVGVVSGGVARFPIFWSLAFCFFSLHWNCVSTLILSPRLSKPTTTLYPPFAGNHLFIGIPLSVWQRAKMADITIQLWANEKDKPHAAAKLHRKRIHQLNNHCFHHTHNTSDTLSISTWGTVEADPTRKADWYLNWSIMCVCTYEYRRTVVWCSDSADSLDPPFLYRFNHRDVQEGRGRLVLFTLWPSSFSLSILLISFSLPKIFI